MKNRRILTRREFLRYSLMAGGGLTASQLLAACAPAATEAPAPTAVPATDAPAAPEGFTGSIERWIPDSRDDAVASSKWMAEAFQAANPGATVNELIVPYGEDTTKLTAGHAAQEVPDITWVYSDFLFTFGLEGIGAPVNHVIEAVGEDRFLGGALDGIRVEGQYYSVPFVGFPFFVYYRKDLYEEAGLSIPTTHEELLENVKALNNPPDNNGFMLTNGAMSDLWNLKTVMWTHGAYFFDENDNLALDRPETIEAWNFYKELGQYSPPGSLSQTDLESRSLMVDGKLGHMFTTTSFSANFTEENIDQFGAFLYPSKPGAKGASLDFYGMLIPTHAKDPDLAAEYIRFFLEHDNFQEYLARTVVGWVPMLEDAYTDQYLDNSRISLVKEFIDIGGQSAANGVVGAGYFGPSPNLAALTSTEVEKQIGDRLVITDEDPEDTLAFALEILEAEL